MPYISYRYTVLALICNYHFIEPGRFIHIWNPETNPDCFISPNYTDFEDILTTIYFLLEKNPQAQFWTTYQVRR